MTPPSAASVYANIASTYLASMLAACVNFVLLLQLTDDDDDDDDNIIVR